MDCLPRLLEAALWGQVEEPWHGCSPQISLCHAFQRRTYCAGPFDGVEHITALLDLTMDRAMRSCLLRLLEAALLPQAAEAGPRVTAANGHAFVKGGGVQLAVDLIAGQQ